jgi:hypothetical protein
MPTLNLGLEKRVNEGSNLEIGLDFDNWQPGGTTSDLVPDGLYEALIMSCLPKENKRKDGVNANIVFKITGPNCAAKGRQIVVYHPIPVGDSQSPENQRKRFMHNLFYSILSGVRGDEAAEALKNAGVRSPKMGWFEGKTAYVKVRETTDNNGRPVGEIQFYMTKKQFEENPGPFGIMADPVDLSKSAAAALDAPVVNAETKPAAATETKPASTKNAVDDMLGI